MKRSELRRKTRLQAKGRLARRTKLKAVNVAATTKRQTRYATKLRLMKRGEGYRLAMARAEGRCEFTIRDVTPETYDPPMTFGRPESWTWRCVERGTKESPLHAHHKTYARFGGNELPDDLLFCCKAHHDYLESKHPTRKRQRKSA